MRIRCPSCSATYEVPDAMLDRPRTVRCARCAHDWMAVAVAEPDLPGVPAETDGEAASPEAPLATAPEVAAHAPEVVEPLPRPEPVVGDTPLSAIERLAIPADLSPRILRRDHLVSAAWAASFVILAALGVAGYTERNLLMRQWPASKRVYATLGLAPLEGKGAAGNGANDKAGGAKAATGQGTPETPAR